MLAFLSRIKSSYVLVVIVFLLLGTVSYLTNEVTYHKSESLRKGQNYKAMRDIDSLKVVNLNFRTKNELEDYIETNNDLKQLMRKQESEYKGKIRKLTNIIYQKNQYIDEMEQSTDVSGLVDDIRNNISASKKWIDSTECLVIKGTLRYGNNVLENIVTERRFESKMVLTGHLRRSQKNWWTRTFGRRKEAIATVTSNCGDTKTIIIDKSKK